MEKVICVEDLKREYVSKKGLTGAVYALSAYAIFGFAERVAQRNGKFDMF